MCIFAGKKEENRRNMQEEFKKLCAAVEHEAGTSMQTPTDFEWLSEKVEARTREHLSASTLMRLWGYRQGVTPRRATLDVLARYLGYADYVTFGSWTPADADDPQSDGVLARHLRRDELKAGEQVELTWLPDRRCVVELRRDGRFEVLEAEATKLCVGDTFNCELFIEGEPLYLSQLIHEGQQPMVYVVGKKDGIRFEVKS